MNVIQPWALRPNVDVGASSTAATSSTGKSGAGPAPEAVGRQFEQLLVRQLLSQVRAGTLSGDASAGPSAGYLQLADDQLAAMVASVGGLGMGASMRRWMQGMAAYRNTP